MVDRDIKCAEWMHAELSKQGRISASIHLPAWADEIFIMREIDGLTYQQIVAVFKVALSLGHIDAENFDIHTFHHNFDELSKLASDPSATFSPDKDYYETLKQNGINLTPIPAEPENRIEVNTKPQTPTYKSIRTNRPCTVCRKKFDLLIEFTHLPKQHFCVEHAMPIYFSQLPEDTHRKC